MDFMEIDLGVLPNILYDDYDKQLSEHKGIYSIYIKEYINNTTYKLVIKSKYTTLDQAQTEYFPKNKKKEIALNTSPNKLQSILNKYKL